MLSRGAVEQILTPLCLGSEHWETPVTGSPAPSRHLINLQHPAVGWTMGGVDGESSEEGVDKQMGKARQPPFRSQAAGAALGKDSRCSLSPASGTL